MRKIPLAAPDVGDPEWHAIREVLSSGWLTQGPKVAQFERDFAQMIGVEHALAVSSATTGLHLALLALGIGPGDEVIVPSFTWVASVNCVEYCGATPVLVDVDPRTFNLTPATVAAAVGPKTRAVIAVHQFGLCADIEALRGVLPAGVALIEDAACAAGAASGAGQAGTLADIAVFSFHPRKSITTGEGGMVTTRNRAAAEKVARLRSHGAHPNTGAPTPYAMPEITELGYNYRMTDLQAAIGIVQLTKLKGYIAERARWAEWYRAQLSGISWLHLPHEPAQGNHAWQSFVVTVDPATAPTRRNDVMAQMAANGIGTRPGTHAVHMLGYYRDKYRIAADALPQAKACDENSMAIPLYNGMTPDDYAHVVTVLRSIDGKNS